MKCSECGSKFYVGGAHGKYLFCPGYQKGICSCKTQLRRDRAERMILDEIGKRILTCPAWSKAVYEETVKAWRQREDQVPAELASTERALLDIDRKISRLVDRIEDGLDDPDISRRLEHRRTERRKLVKRSEQLKQANDNRGPEPTEEWVREQLRNLGDCLKCDTPAAAYALHNLVGGEIVVTEIRQEGRQRFHLHGRFTIRIDSVTDAVAGCDLEVDPNHTGAMARTEEIGIDFVDPNPLDAKAKEAKSLYDQRLMNAEIAQRLGCSRSQVTKLLKHWFESRGQLMPDGRSRRSELDRKHMEPPLFERICEEVKGLCDEGLLLQKIADRMNCDRNTITKAFRYWYESRGLEVPDGRTRRKILNRKVSKPQERRSKNSASESNDV